MRVEVTSTYATVHSKSQPSNTHSSKQLRLTTHLATEAYSLGQMYALLMANEIGCGSHVDVTGQQTLIIHLDQIKRVQKPRKQGTTKS